MKCSGVLGIEIYRDGKLRFEQKGKNRLLDNFFDKISNRADWLCSNHLNFPVFKLGSGLSPTENTMTSLETPWAASPTLTEWPFATSQAPEVKIIPFQDGNIVEGVLIAKTTFAAGQLSGDLGEVGIFYNDGDPNINNSTVNVRYQILDENGTPTTITLDAGDELVLTHEIKVMVVGETTSTFILSDAAAGDSTHTLTRRYTKPDLDIHDLFKLAGSEVNGFFSAIPYLVEFEDVDIYAANSYYGFDVVATFEKIDLFESTMTISFPFDEGNWPAGIRTFKFYRYDQEATKYDINPPITKAHGQTVDITIKRTLSRG